MSDAVSVGFRGHDYETDIDELTRRILSLPSGDVIACESVFGLHKINGFKCDDLKPSLAQASAAFAKAKRILSRSGGAA